MGCIGYGTFPGTAWYETAELPCRAYAGPTDAIAGANCPAVGGPSPGLGIKTPGTGRLAYPTGLYPDEMVDLVVDPSALAPAESDVPIDNGFENDGTRFWPGGDTVVVIPPEGPPGGARGITAGA